jgi:hypothetical protein
MEVLSCDLGASNAADSEFDSLLNPAQRGCTGSRFGSLQRSSKKARSEMHRPEAVAEARGAHLRKHQVDKPGLGDVT